MTEACYNSGERIQVGDNVRIGSYDGTVEEIITQDSPVWDEYWQELGEGVMLQGANFGRMYVEFGDEDLSLIEASESNR